MSVTQSGGPSKQQMILLTLLVLFSPLAIDIYLPALPQISQTFHVEHALAQDTITWFLFAMGVGQLFAGPLADKLGRRTVALGGISIYAVSALLAWSAQSIEWMLTARLLQGLGACATSVAAFATVRDIFGPQRSGKMISYLNGAICFIPALAPILGSWLTQQFGWRANFSFIAGFALTVGLLLLMRMKETNPSTEKQAVFKLSRYWSVLIMFAGDGSDSGLCDIRSCGVDGTPRPDDESVYVLVWRQRRGKHHCLYDGATRDGSLRYSHHLSHGHQFAAGGWRGDGNVGECGDRICLYAAYLPFVGWVCLDSRGGGWKSAGTVR